MGGKRVSLNRLVNAPIEGVLILAEARTTSKGLVLFRVLQRKRLLIRWVHSSGHVFIGIDTSQGGKDSLTG